MTGSQTVVAQREAGQAWSGHREAEGTAQGRAHRACAPAPSPHARLSAEMEAGPWVRSQLFLGSVTLAAAGDPPRPPDLDKQQTPTLGTSRLGLPSALLTPGLQPVNCLLTNPVPCSQLLHRPGLLPGWLLF